MFKKKAYKYALTKIMIDQAVILSPGAEMVRQSLVDWVDKEPGYFLIVYRTKE